MISVKKEEIKEEFSDKFEIDEIDFDKPEDIAKLRREIIKSSYRLSREGTNEAKLKIESNRSFLAMLQSFRSDRLDELEKEAKKIKSKLTNLETELKTLEGENRTLKVKLNKYENYG